MACFDRNDNLYEKSMEAYCSCNNIEPENLNDEAKDVIINRACTHIGYYITWIIFSISKLYMQELY